MCGRYASSRQPEDLVEEFEIRNPDLPHLEPDFNVAPTKEVYAVVERPPSGDKEATPERQLRVLTWGLVPFWAKDPKVGSRMINARMETVAEKPAYRRAFERRRAILPADGYFEWYPTEEHTKAGKPRKQPYFIKPKDDGVLAMAGLYEIWRDPAKAEDDPTRFLWTCTVLTTSAEDSLGHIHDRMPLMLSPDRYEQWLDPRVNATDDLLAPARAGRPRSPRGLPGLDAGLQRQEQRPRAASTPAAGQPALEEWLMPPERMVPDAQGRCPARRTPGQATARDAGAHPRRGRRDRRTRPGPAGPHPAAAGHLGDAGRDAVARGRQEARAGAAGDRRVLHRRARRHAHAQPARARWPQRRSPVGLPDRARCGCSRGARALVPAAPSRAAGEVPPRRAPARPGADAGGAGRARPVRHAGGVSRRHRPGRRALPRTTR